MKSFDPQSLTWSFPIESNWSRECKFCRAKFAQWEERADHLEAHFLRGDRPSEAPLLASNVDNTNLQSMAQHGMLVRII